MNASPKQAWQQAIVVLSGTVVGVVVIAGLYWAQSIFVPVALGVFLAFLANPLVMYFERRRLGRIPSVLVVVLAASLLLCATGWIVTHQVVSLVAELPEYSNNMKDKIKSLRSMTRGDSTRRVGKMLSELVDEASGAGEQKSESAAAKASQNATAPQGTPHPETDSAAVAPPAPVPAATPPPAPPPVPPAAAPPAAPVEQPAWIGRVTSLLGSVSETFGSVLLATILAIFMLLQRETLRNRVIRLLGAHRMTATTKAFDEATSRISRFLLAQLLVNSGYGVTMAAGLFALGVPYALLWGFLAGALRYVPYLGPWIASVPPVLVSIVMFEGWMQPLLVFGLIVVLELILNNVIEPYFYGRSMGVSEVALIVAAAFWAFLWGPIGLVLSSPLTVCLMVMSKYVPQLGVVGLLLSDDVGLSPDDAFYQRLLAHDPEEARKIAIEQLGSMTLEEVYDRVLIHALSSLVRDRDQDALNEEDEAFILQAVRDIAAELAIVDQPAESEERSHEQSRALVLACPARNEADQVALELLGYLLNEARWQWIVVPFETLAAELVNLASQEKPGMVAIGSLAPGGLSHVRYLLKRLRTLLPEQRIVVGRWASTGEIDATTERLREAGADHVLSTIAEMYAHLSAWQPVLAANEQPDSPASSAAQASAVQSSSESSSPDSSVSASSSPPRAPAIAPPLHGNARTFTAAARH